MTTRKSTTERTKRVSLAARAAPTGPLATYSLAGLLAALLLLSLILASRADAYVYWANGLDDTIGRAKLDGTGVDQSFITGAALPCGVAVDDAHVYWANFYPGVVRGDLGFGAIGRAKLDGKGVDHSFIRDAGISPCGVAVDDAHLYWADRDGYTIGRAKLSGTGVDKRFITDVNYPCGVAVDDTRVYWANQFGNTIGRAKLNGTGVDQNYVTGAARPCGVAVDAGRVFWANQFGGTIGRAKLNGTRADQGFITGAFSPCGVAVETLRFRFADVKRNEKRGTASITVAVPVRGDLELAETKRVKGKRKRINKTGKARLPVRPRGKAREKLNRAGAVKVKAKLTYTPDGGGEPSTQTKVADPDQAALGVGGSVNASVRRTAEV